jgi:hypothetical protein
MKMKRGLLLAAVLSIVTLVAACGGGGGGGAVPITTSGNTTTTSGSNYFPISAGSSWTYSSTSSDSTFTYVQTITQSTSSSFSMKTTSTSLPGWTTEDYVLLLTKAWGEADQTLYDDGGNVTQTVTFNPAIPALPSKWDIGTHDFGMSILTSNPPLDIDGLTLSDITVNGSESVTVPAGTFSALKVTTVASYPTISITQSLWFVDGVGIVKSTISTPVPQSSELVSFTIK